MDPATLSMEFSRQEHWKVKVLVTQSCLTLCDPREGSPPGPPSMEFSMQECWSRQPCSQILYSLSHQGSPIGKISFIKIGKRFEQSFTMVVVQSLSHVLLLRPTVSSLPGSSVHGILQARILEWVIISFSRGSSLTQESPALQADSLTLTTASPKNTGVGCLFLLQGIVSYKLPEYRKHVSTHREFLSKNDGLIGSKHLKKSLSNNSQTSKLTMECLQQLHMTENFPRIFGIYLKQPLILHFKQSVGPGSQDTGWDCKAPLTPAQGDGNLLLAP